MRITTRVITRSALLLALALAIQSVRMPQFATGPLVNAILLIAVNTVSLPGAVLIGLCTPFIAFAMGIMPLAPVVPVIMTGNVVLVAVFAQLIKRPVLGIIAAALSKYAVMTLFIIYLLPMLFKIELPGKIVTTLTTPQLFTALAGGVLALLVLKGMQWYRR